MEPVEGGRPDVARLQATMQAVEQACNSVQMQINPTTAEATLIAFRRSPQPYQACQYILEHSQMAIARFQAAAAIQEAAIREWTLLSVDEKSHLRTYCLRYVIAHADAPEAYVQVKVSAVAAVLMKRNWLEFAMTEKEAFFNEVKQAVLGAYGLCAQAAGISFLESLVSEFSPSTASAMGLPAEFHEHCQSSLELDYLQRFYTWAQDAAVSVAEKAVQGTGTGLEVKVCAAALRLMSQILNWDFQGNAIRGAGGVIVVGKNRTNAFTSSLGREIAYKKSGEHYLVQPGHAWHDLLLSPRRVSWLMELYATLRQHGSGDGSWMDSPLVVCARQLIVQLCSLSGSIFSSDNEQSQEQHLQRMLPGIIPWVYPPDAVISAIKSGKSESELLDGCRALLSVASLAAPSVFDQLLKDFSRPLSTLNLLSLLTCEVIKANGCHDEEETWREEALNILLDIWTVLLQPTDLSKKFPSSPIGVSAAATVFNTIVETELRAAAASAYDDGDSTEQLQAAIAARDEQLSSFALIARAAPGTTIPLLAMLFSERCSLLHQCRGGRGDPTRLLEELHWLLLISGHVLADLGDGETPLVPETIQVQFSDIINLESHPVVALSHSVIDLAAQSLDSNIRVEIFSPRLMEAVVWFLARWANTYLMPPDAGRGPNCTPGQEGEKQQGTQLGGQALLDAFGENVKGKVVLGTVVRIAMTTLTSWPGERNLQEIACFQLLPALVRRRNVCVQLLTVEPWQELANVFANEQILFSLAAPLQRSLSETLCRSACGMNSPDATNQYVRDLMGPITTHLTDLSRKSDLHIFAQQPDAIFLVSCLVERLRGAARATQPRSQKAIFEMGTAVMNSLLTFLEAYKNQSSVVYILLKFVVDWVDGQVAFLEPKDTAILFSFCVRLLQIYSAHNIGKVSLSMSRSLLSETETEKYKDLRALLQLLTNLCSKDLVDFSSDSKGESENPDVAQVVYLGLHIITPLISLDLLKYPKLCHQYFALLVHMLEVYPEKVVKLTPEAFSNIVGTLDFGLHHQDVEVVNMTLTALNAIAFYHYRAICAGQEGLGIQAVSTTNTNGAVQEGVLAHFLRSVLQFLLFEDYSNELVSPAADALLPLIMCDMALYQRLAQELLQGQQNVVFQSRLATALHVLINSNQLKSSLDRANRQRFRKNLHEFLADVRGFLRTK